MTSLRAPATETFEFRTRLAPGLHGAYVDFHRAIPADLHRVMAAAGVRDWRIYIRGDVLTHRVAAVSRAALRTELDPHPINVSWQRQVAPFLIAGDEPAAPDRDGALIWDFAWPTR